MTKFARKYHANMFIGFVKVAFITAVEVHGYKDDLFVVLCTMRDDKCKCVSALSCSYKTYEEAEIEMIRLIAEWEGV